MFCVHDPHSSFVHTLVPAEHIPCKPELQISVWPELHSGTKHTRAVEQLESEQSVVPLQSLSRLSLHTSVTAILFCVHDPHSSFVQVLVPAEHIPWKPELQISVWPEVHSGADPARYL